MTVRSVIPPARTQIEVVSAVDLEDGVRVHAVGQLWLDADELSRQCTASVTFIFRQSTGMCIDELKGRPLLQCPEADYLAIRQ